MLNAIVSFKSQLSNSPVDVHIDNKVLKSTLDDDGCRNSSINEVVKEIHRYSRDQNCSIQAVYVPSSHNPADEPSRKCSDLDCMLSVGAGINVFANLLPAGHNIYVFPPFFLVQTSSSLRCRPRVSWRFHAHCSGYSTKTILVGDRRGLLSRSISFGQEGFRFSLTFSFPAFSRMARPSSAVGPLGVPMGLLINIFGS